MGGSAYLNGKEEKTLDNFHPCIFSYKGYTWNSVEQAYQAMKFKDKSHIEKIRKEIDIAIIYFLGQVDYIERTEEWNINSTNEKIRLMYEINMSKISQNDDIMKSLLSSEGDIEYRGDRFWGKKGKRGCNWGGKILSNIRYLLKK